MRIPKGLSQLSVRQTAINLSDVSSRLSVKHRSLKMGLKGRKGEWRLFWLCAHLHENGRPVALNVAM